MLTVPVAPAAPPADSTRCSVRSEVADLQRVLVHRPGPELLRLTPANKDAHLFDDIPWLEGAQAEHDEFAGILRGEGIEVVELTDLLARQLVTCEQRKRFLEAALAHLCLGADLEAVLKDWLVELPPRKLLRKLLAGVTRGDLAAADVESLAFRSAHRDTFLILPSANQMYVRDAGVVVGGTHAVGTMANPIRQLEALELTFAFELPVEEHDPLATLEGGDVLVLGPRCVAVGVGERTNSVGAERLARRLLRAGEVDSVLAVVIPEARATMHLDTVLTMVDWDACTVASAFRASLRAFWLRLDDRSLRVEPVDLFDALADALDVPAVRLVETGGDDHAAVREQWNDANNVLAIRPGLVIAYARNVETNRELRRAGIEVIELPGGELSRGRGGPHCLSHPLRRADSATETEGGDV